MDTGRRQHLQDIYSTDRVTSDDYTPQISNEILEERKREIRRHKFTSFVLGMTVLVLAVSLVAVVVKRYVDMQAAANAPTPIPQGYVPRHSLPKDLQWVLDLPRGYGDPTWTGPGERPFNIEWLLKAAVNIVEGQQAVERGRTDDEALRTAAEKYENVLEIFPDLEGIKLPLGMVYFRLEEYERALALLENVSDNELNFEILSNLGAACIHVKQYDRAEEYLKRALALKPGFVKALKNLAVLYKEQDRPQEAIDAYTRYLDFQPADTDTRYDFALYMIKTDNWKLAAEQLRILTGTITDEHILYQLLARAENKLGNSQAAIAAMRRSYQLSDPSLAIQWMDEEEFERLRNTPEFQALMRDIANRNRPARD